MTGLEFNYNETICQIRPIEQKNYKSDRNIELETMFEQT